MIFVHAVVVKSIKNAAGKMNNLQDQAENLLKKYDIPDRFAKFGQAHLVGNVALKTTVKPDIDVQIYTSAESWQENAETIIKEFKKLGLTDYIKRELKESGKYLVSFAFIEKDLRWTLDITQTQPNEDYLKDAYKFYKEFHQKFNDKNIKTIIRLKKYFLKKNMLHHSMSYYIYRAVTDSSAESIEDIYNYLKENKINIRKFKGKNDKSGIF